MLKERMAPTQAYIESLIAIQLAYINTNHPYFIGGSAAIAMLERTHERRRKEFERYKKHGVALAASRGIAAKDSPLEQQQQLQQQHTHQQQTSSGTDVFYL